MREKFFDPFWHGGAAALLLIALALAIFFYIYEPARLSRLGLENELKIAHDRQQQKTLSWRALQEKRHEIDSGDVETIKEIIRQELLKGSANEFFKQVEK